MSSQIPFCISYGKIMKVTIFIAKVAFKQTKLPVNNKSYQVLKQFIDDLHKVVIVDNKTTYLHPFCGANQTKLFGTPTSKYDGSSGSPT